MRNDSCRIQFINYFNLFFYWLIVSPKLPKRKKVKNNSWSYFHAEEFFNKKINIIEIKFYVKTIHQLSIIEFGKNLFFLD